MHGNIASRTLGQGAPSLNELAARVRKAQAGFVATTSSAVLYAIEAGQALIAAKKLAPHGQWGKFLKVCGIGERQAERYMRLARLVEANPTCKSDLVNLTIETGIKKLSPPKPPRTKERRSTPKIIAAPKAIDNARVTHLDVISAWMASSPAERTKAVDAIGLQALLAVIPSAWWPLIQKRMADHYQVNMSSMPVLSDPTLDDLSIPEFLRREPHSPIEIDGDSR
jgi:hypothetical protein